MDLLSDLAPQASRHHLFAPGENLLLAVSGGLDSMALLSLMHRWAAQTRWALTVAHFNHQLRAEESDADEACVRRTATALGLPFVAGRGDTRALCRQSGLSEEMAARQLRHRFLAAAARDAGCAKIVTGHHANDQVELFFLRLCRGTGTEGLAGMRWRSPSPADPRIEIVRPLLRLSRRTLEAYAAVQRLVYRSDSSNRNPEFARNRIRLELVPLLESAYQPALVETVSRTMEILRADAEAVSALAQEWLSAGTSRSPWRSLPLAVRRRCVVSQLHALGVDVVYSVVEALVSFEPGCVNAPNGLRLRQDGHGHVSFVPPSVDAPPTEPLSVVFEGTEGRADYGACRLEWRLDPAAPGGRPPAEPGLERFDADAVGRVVVLRGWRPGDRFRPIGLGVAAKLQDLFTNAKIGRAERHRRLLGVTEAGDIFWVQGLRIGDAYKLDNRTRLVLTWKWRVQNA